MNYYFQSPRSFSLYSLTGLRDRYLFTRRNRLRLRYSASAVSCVLAAFLVFGLQGEETDTLYNSASDHAQSFAQALNETEPAAGVDGEDENFQVFLSDSLKARISDSMRSAPSIIKKAEKNPYRKVSVVVEILLLGFCRMPVLVVRMHSMRLKRLRSILIRAVCALDRNLVCILKSLMMVVWVLISFL